MLRWFQRYVLYGNTYVTIGTWSGYSIRTLEKQFHVLLQQQPPKLIISQPSTDEAYLLLDGLWFGKQKVLMLYRQSKQKTIIHAAFMAKEYGTLIGKDLKQLKEKGYHFTGIVSDGGTGIEKAVAAVFPHTPHQVCMAHMHRDVTNAIGRHPKDCRTKELKKLADHIWLIESKEALQWWQEQLRQWITTNYQFLLEYKRDDQGHWWYIHKGVRKAVRMLQTIPDRCFMFLSHPLMPKTTNALEGTISGLSQKHHIHRGLKRERVPFFIAWFIYFYNQRILSQKKSKTD